MTQPTPMGLLKVLGHVTLIVAIPMVAGAGAGMWLDGLTGKSPAFAAAGLALGTVVTAVGLWVYVRVNRPRSD